MHFPHEFQYAGQGNPWILKLKVFNMAWKVLNPYPNALHTAISIPLFLYLQNYPYFHFILCWFKNYRAQNISMQQNKILFSLFFIYAY